MKNLSLVFGLILLAIGGFSSNRAAAAQTYYCPSSPSTPYTSALNSIAVQSTLPVGSDIPGTQKTFTFNGNCQGVSGDTWPGQGAAIISCYYGSGGEVAGWPGVYSTGVPGVGISIRNAQGNRVRGAGPGCDTRNDALGYLSYSSSLTFGYSVTLSLVKISTSVSPGTLSVSQTKFGMGVYNTGLGIGSRGPNNTIGYSGNVIIKNVSCTVPSILNLDIGEIPTNALLNIGSIGPSKNLNVPVYCDSPVTVNAMIESPSYASSANGVLGLTPGANVAQGVGIQMLYNNAPVTFGSYVSFGNIVTPNSTLDIPFSFRFYKTASTTTPGSASAVATLTMLYN